MTLRMPGVAYFGPPGSNWSDGELRPPAGMVVHIAEGSFQGTIAWQRNSSADVSSYFVVSKAGEIAQMLDLDLMGWTQGAGNPAWVGVENEGFATEGFPDAQITANARIFAWLRSVWPSIPARVTNSTSLGGLGWHGMGAAAWGNHPGCPGVVNVALLPTILARAGVNPSPGPLPPFGDSDMPKVFRVDQTGLCGVSNGATWSHLKTGPSVNAALRIWGQDKPLAINETDLAGMGVEVESGGGTGGGGGTPVTVDAAAVAKALVADPTFKAALRQAAFDGSQDAEGK